jgi:hypothetical protein
MEDLAGLRKRLSFLGLEIHAVHEGVANTVLVGLRGLVGQLYREDNVPKIRRGMSGRAKDGRSPGGLAFATSPCRRDLIDTVTVSRDTSRKGGVEAEISRTLTRLLGPKAFPQGARAVWGSVVAEEGLEPPTRGL